MNIKNRLILSLTGLAFTALIIIPAVSAMEDSAADPTIATQDAIVEPAADPTEQETGAFDDSEIDRMHGPLTEEEYSQQVWEDSDPCVLL